MTIEQVYTLLQIISIAVGIIGGLCGVGFGIYQFIKSMKGKNFQEILTTLQTIAQTAMKAAEQSGLTGADKKTQVLDAVQAACKSMNVEFTDALKDQISTFIDTSISFANSIKESKTKK